MNNQPLSLDEILKPWRNEISSEYGTGINDEMKRPFIELANAKAALNRLLLQERIDEQEGIKQVLEMARAANGPLAKVNLDGLIEATNNRIAELAALTKEQL